MDDNLDYETEINSLKSRIADLEGELAIAKSQVPAWTWPNVSGIYMTSSSGVTYDGVTYDLPFNGYISGSNWCGT